jgi:hypothetical protein
MYGARSRLGGILLARLSLVGFLEIVLWVQLGGQQRHGARFARCILVRSVVEAQRTQRVGGQLGHAQC